MTFDPVTWEDEFSWSQDHHQMLQRPKYLAICKNWEDPSKDSGKSQDSIYLHQMCKFQIKDSFNNQEPGRMNGV